MLSRKQSARTIGHVAMSHWQIASVMSWAMSGEKHAPDRFYLPALPVLATERPVFPFAKPDLVEESREIDAQGSEVDVVHLLDRGVHHGLAEPSCILVF
jgi:hypothetical protein